MLSNQVPCAKKCTPCKLAKFPLPGDRVVLERLILAFAEMFLSPLAYISLLWGLAFPEVWDCHHVGIGMIDIFDTWAAPATPKAKKIEPLSPATLRASYCRSP